MRRVGVALALSGAVAASALVGTATPASAAITRASCGWQAAMSLDNPPAALRSGVLTLPKYSPVSLPLTGAINWKADPYADPTWRLWFHSLKWMEGLARTGDPADLALAKQIVADFVAHNPDPGTNTGSWADHATSLRTSVLVCLWEQTADDPAFRTWVAGVIAAHAKVLTDRYVGPWNHGMMQNLALLGAGCTLDNAAWRNTAVPRLTDGVEHSVDAQGAMNEQAPGYSTFIQGLLRDVASHVAACGLPVPDGIASRVAALDVFAAQASRPDGTFVQIGDTNPVAPAPAMGPNSAWVATHGAQGTMPADLTKIYDKGYIFGRDSWTSTGQQYSLRFGPGRYVHGHNDHLSMTYWANGRDVLVDAGFSGYADAAYRSWQRSPQAHNVPIVSGAKFRAKAATALVRSSATKDTHSYVLRDTAFAGSERNRTTLFDDSMRLMLVRDDITSTQKRAVNVLWHLDPSWRKERVDTSGRTSRATFLSPDGRYRATVLQIAAPGEQLPADASTLVRARNKPLQGYVARGHGNRTPDWVVEAHRGAANRQSVVTLVLVTSVGQKVSATWTRPGGKDRIRVTVGNHTRVYDSARRGLLSPKGATQIAPK